MPTSYGLSHSTNSLPRSACTIGALSRSAIAMSSSCAPWQPAPARIVTRRAWLSRSAAAARSASPGTVTDVEGRMPVTRVPAGARSRNTSPGTTTTATPRRSIALRMAISRTRGSCSGALTSST